MDRVLRFQPGGTFLRPHIDPGIRIGVAVTAAVADGGVPLQELRGAAVELLDDARFEGHNGVVAADGFEPIVPCRLHISGDGCTLERDATDRYESPYLDVTSLGGFGDLAAARSLRARHGLPEKALDGPRPTPALRAHLAVAAARLRDAIAEAESRGDEDARLVLDRRLRQLGQPAWPFGAIVVWRFPLRGSDCLADVPEGAPAPVTNSPWWLELLSTGFDPDASCALVRGVLHLPLAPNPGPPAWRIELEEPEAAAEAELRSMPVDTMGIRLGQ
jgi:hypothetical protein